MNENESSTTEKNNENSNPEFENVVMNTEENVIPPFLTSTDSTGHCNTLK
jgi:hypothetical protein